MRIVINALSARQGGGQTYLKNLLAHLPSCPQLQVASWAFVIGAITMPVACALMATSPRWWNSFIIPVASLLTGAVLTLWELWHLL